MEVQSLRALPLEPLPQGKDKKTIKLKQTVPVVWLYLDGWASSGGTVHFRDGIYGLDQAQPAGPVYQAE